MDTIPEERKLICKIVDSATFEAGEVPGRPGTPEGLYYLVYHLAVDLGRFQLIWMLYEAIIDLQDLLEEFHKHNEGKPDGRKLVGTTSGLRKLSHREIRALEARVKEANHLQEVRHREEARREVEARQEEARRQAALALQRRENIAREAMLRSLPPFLKLPGEIRNMIYELLLVTRGYGGQTCETEVITDPLFFADGTRLTYNKPIRHSLQCDFSRPSVAILRTCKMIHEEALPILYGENRFRLPTNVYVKNEEGPGPALRFAATGTPWLVHPYNLSARQDVSIFKKYRSLFRHISIHFSLRSGNKGHLGYGVDCLTVASGETQTDVAPGSPAAHASTMVRTKFTRDVWGEMGGLLRSLNALKSVVFTFDSFYRKSFQESKILNSSPRYNYNWDKAWLLCVFDRCLEPFFSVESPLRWSKALTMVYIPCHRDDRETVDEIWSHINSSGYFGRRLVKRLETQLYGMHWADLTAEENEKNDEIGRRRHQMPKIPPIGALT